MKIKEKLANQYLELLVELHGESYVKDEIEFSVDYIVTYNKIDELRTMIDSIKRKIEEKKKQEKVEAYFSTEEGAELKNELLASIEHEKNCYLETIELNEGFIKNKLWQRLGYNWTANLSVGTSQATVEIGLKSNDNKQLFTFGHTFTIYVGKKWHEDKDYTLEVSYGSLGSFNPEVNKLRVEYLLGMGKLVSDTEFLEYVKGTVIETLSMCKEIGDEISQYKDKLANPFN